MSNFLSIEGSQRCTWTETDECWETDCGRIFVLNDGTPAENEMRFCYYCGKPLKEQRAEGMTWESDDAAEPEEA